MKIKKKLSMQFLQMYTSPHALRCVLCKCICTLWVARRRLWRDVIYLRATCLLLLADAADSMAKVMLLIQQCAVHHFIKRTHKCNNIVSHLHTSFAHTPRRSYCVYMVGILIAATANIRSNPVQIKSTFYVCLYK